MSEIELQRAIRHNRKGKKLVGKSCIVCGEATIECLQTITICLKCINQILDGSDHNLTNYDVGDFAKENGDPCIACGETYQYYLRSITICAECRLNLQGLPTIEKHHVFGRKNDPLTVNLPANEHAIITDRQIDFPGNTSKNIMMLDALLIMVVVAQRLFY